MKVYIHDVANIYCIDTKKSINRIEFSNGAVLYNKRSLPELALSSDPNSLYAGEVFNHKFNYHTTEKNIENEFRRLKFIALNSEIKNYIPFGEFNKEKEFIDVSNEASPFTFYCFVKGNLKLYELY